MHLEILSDQQRELLPLISRFKRSFYLAGGTAIALHIGHRHSIDFDLFTEKKLHKTRMRKIVFETSYEKQTLFDDVDQAHFYVNGVKLTFLQYPYPVQSPEKLENIISMPSLLSLAAMKAFALGRRAKWKDYVDLYFLLNGYFSVCEISTEAKQIFGELFSEKLFRMQLAFHKDLDYSEPVEYISGFEVDEQVIQDFLISKSVQNSPGTARARLP
ncbi:MAG: nucleotidyl transferase AbiEii/AbiGii toxin family protein [Methanomicrobiales archaeon]|jgi:hypothetical protein|nr:nucleotidyl transferase AbiEii/AbiGii toxin family protein [Methanomicrobiales archaeon]